MIHLPVAYIGPGAGFAFLGSFFTLVLSLLASIVSLLLWPLRLLRGMRAGKSRQVVLLGLDGGNFDRAAAMMAAGKLSNLAHLKEEGSCRPLRGGEWTGFTSGVGASESAPREPFWKILGRNAIGSTILLVPESFPPDDFSGRILAADSSAARRKSTSFSTSPDAPHKLVSIDNRFEGELPSGVRFRILDPRGDPELEIDRERYALKPHVFTPWIRLQSGGVSGLARFLATAAGAEFSLYVSPIHPDPERPETALSHPRRYSAYLAKLLGPFATLPESGDEAALYSGTIDAEDFLMQVKLAQEEREALFFSALEHQPAGLVACVFDTPRRIEQVFGEYGEVVEWAYHEMDRLVGRTLEKIRPGAAVLVVSNSPQGVLFSNRKLDAESAALEDIAPTVLGLFGIERPEWMDGRPIIRFA
jgi:hypothetical protein